MDTTKAQSSSVNPDSSILDAISNAKSIVDSFSGTKPSPTPAIPPELLTRPDVDITLLVGEPDELNEKMRSNILDLTTQVINNCNNDRDEYSDVIIKIKRHIDSRDVIHSGAVRTLLEAIKGRSDVNATKVKMIDVCNKVLNGGKPSMINTNNVAVSSTVDKELIDLLSSS